MGAKKSSKFIVQYIEIFDFNLDFLKPFSKPLISSIKLKVNYSLCLTDFKTIAGSIPVYWAKTILSLQKKLELSSKQKLAFVFVISSTLSECMARSMLKRNTSRVNALSTAVVK